MNALLPEEKIFVQKEVKFVDDDFARVTIKVRNLGGVPVEDLLVSDFIDENAIVKDISQVFSEKRGVWKIKNLNLVRNGRFLILLSEILVWIVCRMCLVLISPVFLERLFLRKRL